MPRLFSARMAGVVSANRLKGRPVAKSSLGHEVAALVHALAAGVLRTPIIELQPI